MVVLTIQHIHSCCLSASFHLLLRDPNTTPSLLPAFPPPGSWPASPLGPFLEGPPPLPPLGPVTTNACQQFTLQRLHSTLVFLSIVLERAFLFLLQVLFNSKQGCSVLYSYSTRQLDVMLLQLHLCVVAIFQPSTSSKSLACTAVSPT